MCVCVYIYICIYIIINLPTIEGKVDFLLLANKQDIRVNYRQL